LLGVGRLVVLELVVEDLMEFAEIPVKDTEVSLHSRALLHIQRARDLQQQVAKDGRSKVLEQDVGPQEHDRSTATVDMCTLIQERDHAEEAQDELRRECEWLEIQFGDESCEARAYEDRVEVVERWGLEMESHCDELQHKIGMMETDLEELSCVSAASRTEEHTQMALLAAMEATLQGLEVEAHGETVGEQVATAKLEQMNMESHKAELVRELDMAEAAYELKCQTQRQEVESLWEQDCYELKCEVAEQEALSCDIEERMVAAEERQYQADRQRDAVKQNVDALRRRLQATENAQEEQQHLIQGEAEVSSELREQVELQDEMLESLGYRIEESEVWEMQMAGQCEELEMELQAAEVAAFSRRSNISAATENECCQLQQEVNSQEMLLESLRRSSTAAALRMEELEADRGSLQRRLHQVGEEASRRQRADKDMEVASEERQRCLLQELQSESRRYLQARGELSQQQAKLQSMSEEVVVSGRRLGENTQKFLSSAETPREVPQKTGGKIRSGMSNLGKSDLSTAHHVLEQRCQALEHQVKSDETARQHLEQALKSQRNSFELQLAAEKDLRDNSPLRKGRSRSRSKVQQQERDELWGQLLASETRFASAEGETAALREYVKFLQTSSADQVETLRLEISAGMAVQDTVSGVLEAKSEILEQQLSCASDQRTALDEHASRLQSQFEAANQKAEAMAQRVDFLEQEREWLWKKLDESSGKDQFDKASHSCSASAPSAVGSARRAPTQSTPWQAAAFYDEGLASGQCSVSAPSNMGSARRPPPQPTHWLPGSGSPAQDDPVATQIKLGVRYPYVPGAPEATPSARLCFNTEKISVGAVMPEASPPPRSETRRSASVDPGATAKEVGSVIHSIPPRTVVSPEQRPEAHHRLRSPDVGPAPKDVNSVALPGVAPRVRSPDPRPEACRQRPHSPDANPGGFFLPGVARTISPADGLRRDKLQVSSERFTLVPREVGRPAEWSTANRMSRDPSYTPATPCCYGDSQTVQGARSIGSLAPSDSALMAARSPRIASPPVPHHGRSPTGTSTSSASWTGYAHLHAASANVPLSSTVSNVSTAVSNAGAMTAGVVTSASIPLSSSVSYAGAASAGPSMSATPGHPAAFGGGLAPRARGRLLAARDAADAHSPERPLVTEVPSRGSVGQSGAGSSVSWSGARPLRRSTGMR